MSKYKVSACLIVKNEEKYIEQAVSSAKKMVDEVIVVDHNSTDLTVTLAQKAGGVVYSRIWGDHFAEARNDSIRKASNPFILIMDADEMLDTDEHSLQFACQSLRGIKGSAARVQINNITEQGTVSSWITRLFPNEPGYQFHGRIHEQLLYNGKPCVSLNSSIELNHFGYSAADVHLKDKIKRNVKILFSELNNRPNDPYVLFQLGRTYEQAKDWSMAYKFYIQAHELINTPYPPYYSTLLHHISKVLMKLEVWDKFLDFIHFALEKYPDYTDLYYMYGSGIIEAKNIQWFPNIPRIFNACLQLGEPDPRKYETTRGVGSYKAHYNLGLYYELTASRELAVYHYEQSGEYGFTPAKLRLEALIK
ncbi:glycosyltransferase [Paenibacillus terreus]|uniref:Glycosyltransferase n=1 Tax=Paenibacillus terreus TaxID=1387834 RepID=A0ABV5BBF4_9BACL